MIPELGQFALILALLLAVLQAFFGIAGPALGRERWTAAVVPAVAGQFVMVSTAMGCLMAAFIGNDFSVRYVAENSNSALPLFYRIAGVWGAHSGSLLLWIFLLACWTVAAAIGTARLPRNFAARVLGVLGTISIGFLLYTLITSNPFVRLDPPWADGLGLNPILQDPGLAVHPPVLYTGYVGLAVAFAFAGAALLEGRLDREWARWTRPWATSAWAFLTCGITLGSWWAYYTLGWGGFWFWDPVENASFMPWLMGTALIHSLAVTEKRGLFKSWTLLLAVLGFSLSLIGTFLVRSGVLISVHSFVASPGRGEFILTFLVIMIGAALALYAWRAPQMQSEAGFELSARESFLLFNNILLVTACGTVFAGEMAPIISLALHLGKLSVGPPYFNPTFLVSMLPLLALLPLGIHARWKRGGLGERGRTLLITLAAAALIGCAVAFGVFTGAGILSPVSMTLGAWIILASLIDPIDRLRRRIAVPRAVLGMTVAHIGLGVFVIAMTAVQGFTAEQDVALTRGMSARDGGYTFQFERIKPVHGPNYGGAEAKILVTRNGHPVTVMYPQKRTYWVQHMVTTHSAIDLNGGSNILVALGQDLGDGRWSFRLQVRPLVLYIWIGALIMAAGGLLAITDRRYRLAEAREAAPDGPLPAGGLEPMMRYFAPLAVFAVIVVIFAFGLHQAPRKDLVPSPLIGKPAPSFTLPSLADPQTPVSNAALRGHWYLLNVWGTWCVSCRIESPELLAIAHTGVVPVIGLDWKDRRSAAIRYLQQRGNPYQQIAFDPGGLEAIHWGVYGAPETFIVNPQGIIVYKYIGPITPGAWARDFLPRLRAGQAVSGS